MYVYINKIVEIKRCNREKFKDDRINKVDKI